MKIFITAVILSTSIMSSASPLGCMSRELAESPFNFIDANDGHTHFVIRDRNQYGIDVFSWVSGFTFAGIWGYRATENNIASPEDSLLNILTNQLYHCGCTLYKDRTGAHDASYSGVCSTVG